MRDTIILLVRREGSPPPINDLSISRPPAVTDSPPPQRVTSLSSSSSECHVLHCRLQPTPTEPIYNREGGRLLDITHGRSRMTIDPRISTIPGRSSPGFHRPGRHCLHQVRSTVRCPASRMKGGMYLTKNRLRGGLAYG